MRWTRWGGAGWVRGCCRTISWYQVQLWILCGYAKDFLIWFSCSVFWYVYLEIYPMHICWFNFDAEATPPAASCPARTLHATEIAPKNATPMTCPRLHWTTDNPSGMHRCQFQHLCVLILNCALALAIYIFVGLILMLWHRETHINPQRNR